MFIAPQTMSFAEKSFYVIPVVKYVGGNECITCSSINDVKETCEAECDKIHVVLEQLWACYNGCSITGGILKVNYLCPGDDCP